jgi:hypothetical protein
MGVSSVRCRALIAAFKIAHPLDRKIITARFGIAYVDVDDIPILQQLLELGLDYPIGNIPLRHQTAAVPISIEGEPVAKHIHRKASILGISIAIVLVDENRAGKRKTLPSVEGIVSEQYPTITTDGKRLQTLPAWAVAGGHFGVRRMTVPW